MSLRRPEEQTIKDFYRSQEPLLRQRVGLTLILAAVLTPFFGWVDYVLYPSHSLRFMAYRLLASLCSVALYLANRRWNLGYQSFYLGVAIYYLVGLVIIKMILSTDGYASPYYAGLNLVFLAFCTVLTVRVRQLALHTVILYAVFFIFVLWFGKSEQHSLFLGNNMFMIATIVLALVASSANHDLRLSEYKLRQELEKAQARLEVYSRKLENDVAESEEKYKLVVDNAAEGIVVVQGGALRFANPRALELFGCSGEDLTATAFLDFVHPDDRTLVEGRHQLPTTTALRDPYEFRIIDKYGRIRWLETRMASINWELSPAVLDLLNDVTERRLAEEALKKANDELERRVRERTAELEAAQEELVSKEKFAVLGKLTAVVSHELRNPLGTIRASLFSIRERTTGKALGVERALDRSERNIVRCDKIIEELLDYTRNRELELEPTKLDEWLHDALEEQPIPPGVRLVRDLSSGAVVRMDRERFRRCLLNVISNACQAMEDMPREENSGSEGEDRGLLRVESRRVGERVEVRITDTGPGIAPAELEKIFQPLYSTKGFGVGLGLPIVKQIMEQHGGGIAMQSELGRGTTATLWLPVDSGDER